MRILHTEASTGWGGQDMRVLVEAREMARRGHDVTLACAPDCRLFELAKASDLRVEPVTFGRKINREAVAAVRRLIGKYNIEIVNTHSSGDAWSGSMAARLSRKKGRPLSVRTRHLSLPVKNSFANRFLYGKLTDFVIVTGEALREQLMRDNGMDGAHIVSIPTGVDTEDFDPARWQREPFRREIGADDDTFVWGMIAMIRRMKGHTVLADAAAILLKERPNLRFVIVGEVPTESPVRTEFEVKLEELKLGDKFVMTGYREDVPQIMAGCDATVLPSLFSEGVPQSMTQSLAMAKPVVASAVGSTPEIVRDGETGLLVPPGDAQALANAMRSIMDDRPAALEMGRRGRALIEAEYSLQAMTDQVERAYEQLLAKHPAK